MHQKQLNNIYNHYYYYYYNIYNHYYNQRQPSNYFIDGQGLMVTDGVGFFPHLIIGPASLEGVLQLVAERKAVDIQSMGIPLASCVFIIVSNTRSVNATNMQRKCNQLATTTFMNKINHCKRRRE